MNTNREQMSLDTLASKQPIVNGLGATLSLREDQSGSIIVLDKADGCTITLPTYASAGKAGMVFDFYVGVTETSSAYKIITGVGTELLVGQILNCDTDTSDAVAIWKSLVASSNISVNLNGTTKGGVKGDWIRFTNINATTWVVNGMINGNGVVATPFANS